MILEDVLIQHKQSDVAGRVPQIVDLEMGELAINTHDGKLFFKRDDGTETIQSIVTTNTQVTGSIDLTGTVESSQMLIQHDNPTDDLFRTTVSGSNGFRVNSQGLPVINRTDPLPTGEDGALTVSGSNFFIFL